MRLILASSNRGKLVEMRDLLSGLEIELIPQRIWASATPTRARARSSRTRC
jgi:inosine/xanthosine triphosphate pyrophosphatase family protein